MHRWWLIVVWFVLLFVWNLYPAWSFVSPYDMSEASRLALIALHKSTGLTGIMLSVAVIVLIFTVKMKNRVRY